MREIVLAIKLPEIVPGAMVFGVFCLAVFKYKVYKSFSWSNSWCTNEVLVSLAVFILPKVSCFFSEKNSYFLCPGGTKSLIQFSNSAKWTQPAICGELNRFRPENCQKVLKSAVFLIRLYIVKTLVKLN